MRRALSATFVSGLLLGLPAARAQSGGVDNWAFELASPNGHNKLEEQIGGGAQR